MSYVLIYTILIGNVQYALVEPMYSLNQCRRIASVMETSDKVIEVRCGALILEKEKEE